MHISFTVNQQPAQFEGPPDVPLLWVVREQLGLTGSKYGCGIGACGACTVHIDGKSARSCITPIAVLQGRQVTTIEGLAPNADHPVQRAWRRLDVPQCGYCQSGMIMAAAHLLSQNPAPSDSDIDRAMTNLCRCATYVRIRKAIHLAAQLAKTGGTERT
jgi:isoquinoline 1-oxidoreductase subunit alpha